ncbi:MAG: aminoglycoside phosphotransferase family protein [Bacteroidota bacterium]
MSSLPLHHFPLPGTIDQIEPITLGLINQTFKVRCSTPDGPLHYILQQINTSIFRQPVAVMDNIQQVAAFLSGSNYPRHILQALPTKTGESFCVDVQNQYWRLYPFLENSLSVQRADRPEWAYEAAYTFGEYARYLADFDVGKLQVTVADFHHTPKRFAHFQTSIGQASEERLAKARALIENLLNAKHLLAHYPALENCQRVVHYDTKISNVLLDAQTYKGVCVIDLDTLMPGMLAYDYGDMVRTFAPPVDENATDLAQVFVRPDILQATREGFLEGIKDAITKEEKEQLTDGARLIIYEQSLRFLTDYLQGDLYYSTSHPEQNLQRAQNQWTLLQDFLRQTT